MINKRVMALTLVFGIYSPSLVAGAITTVTGYKSINNSSDSSYKTSEGSMKSLVDSVNRPSDYKEIINYSDARKVIDSNPELSYLIENNLVSSDISIDYDRSDIYKSIRTKESIKFDYVSDGKINKSDFLATLSKSVFGVQESRNVLFHSNATREINGNTEPLYISSSYTPDGYNGEDDSFDFSKGDYNVFVTPNVYELYYKTLINKGVVSLSEFSDLDFINSMQSYGTNQDGKSIVPIWDPSLNYYNVSSYNSNVNVSIQGDKVLGAGFELVEDNKTAKLKPVNHSWFLQENLSTMDALKYIEKALRVSEKEMTKTEAELINYKYGVSYLNRLDSDSKNTVMFLVAKGVLNFENEDEFKNLYKDLTGSFFRTLMYRVHNKDARYDFSKVQLTDSDNYWLSRGYYKNEVNLYYGKGAYFDTEVKELTQASEEKNISNLFGLVKNRPVTIADGSAEFEVKRTFYNTVQYSYKGKPLSANTKAEDEITKVEKDGDALVITFKIKSSNSVAAIATLDANITTSQNGVTSIGSIPAVSTVKSDKKEDTYVSQSALTLPGFTIMVLEDKYLVNKETGARALLLNDNFIALVGNEIIRTGENMVSGINGEVYYNLRIISKLLSDAMVSSLDPSSWYITKGAAGKEDKFKFLNSSGSIIEELYVRKFDTNTIMTDPVNGNSIKPSYFLQYYSK